MLSGFVAFALTVFIFSYLVGDNALFRATISLFVGVSAGYVATVVAHQVLWPRLIAPLISGNSSQRLLLIIPFVLSGLLILKLIPGLAKAGSPAVAFMVGVGAAVAIGGALLGTLFPQTLAAINVFDLRAASARGVGAAEQFFNGSILLVGTVSTLAYFQFSAKRQDDGSTKRSALLNILALSGRVFIGITLGVIFAGVYAAALTAFIERLLFLWTFIHTLF
ncbi:MAG: hypothetical protein L3J16_04700 [Anaerolineales bacterium]|nr:hypothetical protein [Anaerolineales bacterium]